jgi:uncharacterized protein
VCVAIVAFALTTGTAAATPSFSAHGSVQQVYVTGAPAGSRMSLLDSSGKTVATKRVDSLGGLLFRDVKPGSGYRVRLGKRGEKSDPLTVLTTQPAPPSTDVYNQTIPSDGYGYLTTRDGTKLAIYVHPPQDISGALPTGYLPPAPKGRRRR